MIARALAGAIVAGVFALAPLQCPHETDAAHCWDDAPGDSLWDLAQKFRDNHDEAGARRTLQFLVERYPSSRFAPAAREQLGLEADASPVARDP
jgi:outer membrane protein assembly factor BamD (BamD/ComL family)